MIFCYFVRVEKCAKTIIRILLMLPMREEASKRRKGEIVDKCTVYKIHRCFLKLCRSECIVCQAVEGEKLE